MFLKLPKPTVALLPVTGRRYTTELQPLSAKIKRWNFLSAGTGDLTPAFLNSAVGQLYGSFPAESIESNLSFTNILEEDEIILKRVIERAKTYFEHAYSCRKTLRDELGGEDA